MPSVKEIFEMMPGRYRPGRLGRAQTYYFSVGEHRYTVKLTPEACVVETGKTVENADTVLKVTPELFERMVVQGKVPGAMDIALGRIKTNDPTGLQKLKDLFDFSR